MLYVDDYCKYVVIHIGSESKLGGGRHVKHMKNENEKRSRIKAIPFPFPA